MTTASRPPTSVAAVPARRVRLFRNGRSQAVRIPRDLEMPGDEVVIRREGDRLILEPVGSSMAELLASLRALGPIDEPWPDVDEGLLPLEPVPDFGEE